MTDRSKNILAIFGFLLALYIGYHFAIKKTMAVKKEYTMLSEQHQLLRNTPKQLSLLRQKEIYYDSILSKYQLTGSSIQTNLLKTINAYAEENSLKIIDFLEPHSYDQNDLTAKTYQFSLEGDYNSIMTLLHRLEQQTKFGEIINLHLEKKRNFRSGKDYLQARILLRTYGQK